MTSLAGYDAWLTREPREPSPQEGDRQILGTTQHAEPCCKCGKPCAVVHTVSAVWSFDGPDEWGAKGGMRLDEETDLDEERTTVANPDAPASAWRCVVCADWTDEDSIVRPEVTP